MVYDKIPCNHYRYSDHSAATKSNWSGTYDSITEKEQ